MAHSLTDEQIHILDLAKTSPDNLMINSYAGTGKTSTLEMIDKISKQRPVLYLVFNKRNADEAVERMASTTTVRTMNALGHRIWQSAIRPRLKIEKDKIYKIVKDMADEAKSEARTIWDCYEQVKFGVDMARAVGYVPEGIYPQAKRLISRNAFHNYLDEEPDDLVADLIDAILKRSIALAYEGTIDFNDQVYMSALFGGTYPQYPLTLVDEYQDLNPVNHEMIRKLVGKRRLIGVGDPHQNIYGFRGASKDGMSQAIEAYSMLQTELSISFRCPEAIVRNARRHVPQFKWFRKGGSVKQLESLSISEIPDDATFLCRLNAPLFAFAMRLLANGRSVNLAGSDIGPRLIKQMRKLGDENLSRSAFLDAIAEWESIKLAKNSKTAADTANCMRVFASHGDTLGQAVSYAEHLFKQRGAIQLMTGHKAKGLEFPTVYHLDPETIRDGAQEKNIRYVIQTRSSDRYLEISTPNIKDE